MPKYKNTLDTLLPYFSSDKNNGKDLSEFRATIDPVVWSCSSGHEWTDLISTLRHRKHICPECAPIEVRNSRQSRKTSVTIKEFSIDLFEQLHPDKNHEFDLDELTIGSGKLVWWVCLWGHEYQRSPYARTSQGMGCSICKPTRMHSKLEIRLYCELSSIFQDATWCQRIQGREVDIFLPSLSLGIEVDGYPFHEGKEDQDRKKEDVLHEIGISLVRVRSVKLQSISNNEISVAQKEWNDHRKVCTLVARRLLSLSGEEYSGKLQSYIESKEFVNHSAYQQILSRLPAPPEGKSFLDRFPEQAARWDYESNYPLTPEMFPPYSLERVSWFCDNNHTYATTIAKRAAAKGFFCHPCTSTKNLPGRKIFDDLVDLYPNISRYWHPTKNGDLTPHDVSPGSGRILWFKCEEGHDYPRKAHALKRTTKCPYCLGSKVGYGNSLADLHPALSMQWHDQLNGNLTPFDVVPGSGRQSWWECEKKHLHKTEVRSRVKSGTDGCGYCSGRLASEQINLEVTYPEIAREWHPIKNLDLKPIDVPIRSGKSAWWRCKDCGHEWKTRVIHRTHSKSNCKLCAYKKTALLVAQKRLERYGSLASKRPLAHLMWDEQRNGDVTVYDVGPNSKKVVWWRCPKGHSFTDPVSKMGQRRNSLYCRLCNKVFLPNEFSDQGID